MIEKIIKRLLLLDENLKKLKLEKTISLEEYLKNYRTRAVIERLLQITIEDCISIGNMIISFENFKKPETYADIFIELAANNIIPENLKEEFVKIARFRNMLTHIYWEINDKLVYEIIQKHPCDFDAFIKNIKLYIEKKSQRI